jgi:hypothetical protein
MHAAGNAGERLGLLRPGDYDFRPFASASACARSGKPKDGPGRYWLGSVPRGAANDGGG